MRKLICILLLVTTNSVSLAGFEGHKWGEYTRHAIQRESINGNYVSDCYPKQNPESLAVNFGTRKVYGLEVLPVMQFTKSGKLFYGYLSVMDDISNNKFKEITSSLDSKHKRIPKPYTASSLNHKMWWESEDSYIFLIWIPSSFLSINYVTKDYSFDRGIFISESFGNYN
jgi:hypothetical protein|tara:strand:+ start:250 stop:759 length:510 start_codon:yes stop_codon:yes gene_type:complete